MESGSDLLVSNLLYDLPKFEEETNLVKTVGHKDFLLFFKVMYNIYVTDYRVIITDGFTDKEIRSIAIGNLAGITKSSISNYIVFHWERDFDEMLEVARKDDIIDMTKRVYSNLTKKNLPIFEIDENKLDSYVTSQSEADDGITRMPDRSTRLRSDRLVYDSSSSEEEGEDQDKENQVETHEDFNLKKTPPKRNKGGEGMVELYNKSDAIGIEQKDMNSGGNSEMIFSRNKKITKEKYNYTLMCKKKTPVAKKKWHPLQQQKKTPPRIK